MRVTLEGRVMAVGELKTKGGKAMRYVDVYQEGERELARVFVSEGSELLGANGKAVKLAARVGRSSGGGFFVAEAK